MRPDIKQRRQSRLAGPALVRKDPIHGGESKSVSRVDPFGVHDYFVDYSLSKKQRWAINEEIASRIEEVQDFDCNIRVSASLHGAKRGNATIEELLEPRNHLPCLEYHTVSREGDAVHKHSARGQAQLRSYTEPANPPKAKGRSSRAARIEQQLNDQTETGDNEVHIHYTTRQASSAMPIPSRVNSKSSTNRGNRRFMTDFGHPSEFIDDCEDIVFEDVDNSPVLFVEDLISLLVFKNDTRKRKTSKAQRARFVDETLKPAFVPASFRSVVASAANDDDDGAPNPSLTLPTEMLTRLDISSLPLLQSAPRLACFPPTWEIHQKDTLRFLGMALPHCVIARQCWTDIRLGIVEDCPSMHPARLQLSLVEDKVPPKEAHFGNYFCLICYEEMDFVDENRLNQPFALLCAHLFCTGCWLSHISESIRLQQLPTACMHPGCPATVSFSAAKALLSSSSYATYEQATIIALKDAQTTMQCPECTRFLQVSGGQHISCPCGASLCASCHAIHHAPLSCEAFRQFDKFMRGHGFAPVYSASSNTPRISGLTKCPKCELLMERSAGCNTMTCLCGMIFCYNCSGEFNEGYHNCARRHFEVTMIDVATRDAPLLEHTLLPKAIDARIELIDRRKMLRQRLLGLPSGEKRMLERVFVQLSLLVELCGLATGNDRATKRSLAKRVRSVLDIFLNSTAKDATSKGRELKEFHDRLLH